MEEQLVFLDIDGTSASASGVNTRLNLPPDFTNGTIASVKLLRCSLDATLNPAWKYVQLSLSGAIDTSCVVSGAMDRCIPLPITDKTSAFDMNGFEVPLFRGRISSPLLYVNLFEPGSLPKTVPYTKLLLWMRVSILKDNLVGTTKTAAI